jgi:phospholipid/cholesterol/gamma-HCH transport system ATP-binding protein
MMKESVNKVIEVRELTTAYKGVVIHDSVSFSITKGEFYTVIGGSGSGKTTLMRVLVGLLKPYEGEVFLLGENLWSLEETEREKLLRRIAVLFQEGALFSGLTVRDNIIFPLQEFTTLHKSEMDDLADFWLTVVGLPKSTAVKMPSELSGGMRKRVALARALVMEPEVLFLDEPASGLDPVSARSFDALVKTLHDELGVTIFMISHDLASVKKLSTKVLALGHGKILAEGSLNDILETNEPWIRDYFNSV